MAFEKYKPRGFFSEFYGKLTFAPFLLSEWTSLSDC